jgi:hypothetical protein
MHHLARKNLLALNIRQMQQKYPVKYGFLPPSWVLPDDIKDFASFFSVSQPFLIARRTTGKRIRPTS